MSKGFICNVTSSQERCKMFTTCSDEKVVFKPKDVGGEGWWRVTIETPDGARRCFDVCGDHKTVLVASDGSVFDATFANPAVKRG